MSRSRFTPALASYALFALVLVTTVVLAALRVLDAANASRLVLGVLAATIYIARRPPPASGGAPVAQHAADGLATIVVALGAGELAASLAHGVL